MLSRLFSSCTSLSPDQVYDPNRRAYPDWSCFPKKFILESQTMRVRRNVLTLSICICQELEPEFRQLQPLREKQYSGYGFTSNYQSLSNCILSLKLDAVHNTLDILKIDLDSQSTVRYNAKYQSHSLVTNTWVFKIEGQFINDSSKRIFGVLKIRSLD